MVGPNNGWVAGSHAIYATTDGSHWSRQYASTNDYVSVDFVSTTTGWVVGLHELLGTADGGHSWHALGEAPGSLRGVHFVNALQGWGIAGGSLAQPDHGTLLPDAGAALVTSTDGGVSWKALSGPANPQSVCFSDPRHGWLATQYGFIYTSADGGLSWAQSLAMYAADPNSVGKRTRIQCAAPAAAWVQETVENGAAGHLPYVVYATQDGHTWRTVMTEPFTIGSQLPGVPAGPDTHPGSFSVVNPLDAVFIGDGPATNVAACLVANGGGATLRRTGRIDNSSETYGAAFVSVSTGWVLTRNANGDTVIDATTDGGYHWTQQLAVAASSAG
jgi:photosystem II stability/assembly factor-like uncharacterized protein